MNFILAYKKHISKRLRENGLSYWDLNRYIRKRAVYPHHQEQDMPSFPVALEHHKGLGKFLSREIRRITRSQKYVSAKKDEKEEMLMTEIMFGTAMYIGSRAQFADTGCLSLGR